MEIEALQSDVEAVSAFYAERHGIARTDDWFLLKLAEEVGELMQEAGENPQLIPYAWVNLATRLHAVSEQIDPHVLYGVWHLKPGEKVPAYVVGVEVPEGEDVPDGLTRVVVPAGRCITMTHHGDIGAVGQTYEAIMRHMKQTQVEHRAGPTFEVYDTRQPLNDDYAMPIFEPVC